MGIAADLHYEIKRANWFQRSMQAFAGTTAGGWFFSRVLRHVDDVFLKVTGGRTTSAQVLAGLPVLDVTTTGRRSGQPRTSHLISVPYGDELALLGTNFGQPGTPAWVLNLEADPHATARFRERTAAIRARPATDAEFAGVLAASGPVYAGYRKYVARLGDRRQVRIFLLEPVGENPA